MGLLTRFKPFQVSVLLFPRWGRSRDSASAESQAEFVRSRHPDKNPDGRDMFKKVTIFGTKKKYLMQFNFFVSCVVNINYSSRPKYYFLLIL